MTSCPSIGPSNNHSNISEKKQQHKERDNNRLALEALTRTFIKYIYVGMGQENQKAIFSAFTMRIEKNSIRIIPKENVDNKTKHKIADIACKLPTLEFIKTIQEYQLPEVQFQYSFSSTIINLPECIVAAVQKGDAPIWKFLIDKAFEKDVHLNEPYDDEGHTLLNMAAYEGRKEVIQYVKEKGISLSLIDHAANPIMGAMYGNNKDMLQYLIEECHLDLFSYKLNSSETLLENILAPCVVEDKELNLFKYLFQKMKDAHEDEKFKYNMETTFIVAAKWGFLNIVKFLFDEGVDINVVYDKNKCALSEAIRCKQTKIVEYLIEKHADINVTDSEGNKIIEKF